MGTGPSDEALARLIRPASVAIVGASERPGASSGFVMRNLLAQGYGGRIHPIHRTAETVFGLPAVSRLADLGVPPDAVLVGLPAGSVCDVLDEAGALGVRAAVVLASGFAETGPEGALCQERLKAVADRHDMAVCGPNCLGLFETASGLALYSSRLAPILRGNVAIVSHSGALGIALAHSGRFGVSLLVSAGNAAVTDMPDYLRYLAADARTTVALLVLEQIRDPDALALAVAGMNGAGKRVIVLRAGRSAMGARASAAHTGSLTGPDDAFLSFFERIGVHVVDDVATAVETAALLSARSGNPLDASRGSGVVLVGVSGGGMAHVSDVADAVGLALPSLGPQTTETLRAGLPGFATPQNPLDLTGVVFGDADIYGSALRALADDPATGAIVAVQDVPAGLDNAGAAEYSGIGDAIARFGASSGLPFIVLSNLAEVHPAFAGEIAGRVPLLRGARPGLLALKALLQPPMPAPIGSVPALDVDPPWAARLRAGGLTERSARAFLAAHGLPAMQEGLARTADEAVALWRSVGGVVALKVESPAIAHKTEVGGVRLGLAGEREVREGFAGILADAARLAPGAVINGVLVQSMAGAGTDIVLSTAQHPIFGPVMTVGSGGVLVELVRDVAVEVLPVDHDAARRMLARTRVAMLLEGYRGAQAGDVEALLDAMVTLGRIASAYRSLVDTIEINPLRVLPVGQGVMLLDALVVPR